MVLEVPVYRNASGVNNAVPVVEEVNTHCIDMISVMNKFFEVLIHWDIGTLEWVEDPVFLPGESIVALKIIEPCSEAFWYVDYPINDFRLAQICCRTVPMFQYTVNASGENMTHEFEVIQAILTSNIGKSFSVDWGDGSAVEPFNIVDESPIVMDHTYTTPGNYLVKIFAESTVVKEYSVLQGVLTGTFLASKGNQQMNKLFLTNQTGINSVPNTTFNEIDLSGTSVTTFQFTKGGQEVKLSNNNALVSITKIPGGGAFSLFADNCSSLNDAGLAIFNAAPWGMSPQALSFNNNAGITNLGFNSGFQNVTEMLTLRFMNTGMTQNEVNASLIALAADNGVGGTYNSSGTFAPSGGGIAAKATLQGVGRTWTVTTD